MICLYADLLMVNHLLISININPYLSFFGCVWHIHESVISAYLLKEKKSPALVSMGDGNLSWWQGNWEEYKICLFATFILPSLPWERIVLNSRFSSFQVNASLSMLSTSWSYLMTLGTLNPFRFTTV